MIIIFSSPYMEDFIDSSMKHRMHEFRLDLSGDLKEVKWHKFNQFTILTNRGEDPDKQIFKRMLSSKAMIDLDIEEYQEYAEEVPSERLILSTHLRDFDQKQIEDFLDTSIGAKYYKLIFEPKSFSEMTACAKMIAARPNRKYIFNALGKWAFFQRTFFYHFNSIAAYFALIEPVVHSQPNFWEFTKVLAISQLENIVLLIGGGDLSKSGSMTWGNDFYSDEELQNMMRPPKSMIDGEEYLSLPKEKHYAYLPAPINDIAELHEVLDWLKSQNAEHNVFGLAITSPFKHEMAKYLGSHRHGVNTVAFWKEKTFKNSYHEGFESFVSCTNTDIAALSHILRDMKIAKDALVQLYGSGDCAYAFAAQLKRQGYTKLYLNARNKEKLKELSATLELPMQELEKCDLLINTTPLGMQEEDDLSVLPEFSALIDLAILGNNESKLIDIAYEKDIPFADGEDFWVIQHIFQRKEIDEAAF
ncbi:MAG TPA: hypothetical protein GXX77_06400 [Candidatus Cloacimonetes bacterium]|nr:hypothetical protein [Candidatus Cloacimonadota bacterium]